MLRAYELNIKRHGPVGPPALSWAATAFWSLGRRDEAARAVARLTTQFPDFCLRRWNFFEVLRLSEDRARIYDLMKVAGLPE
jgi:hypothetical protein